MDRDTCEHFTPARLPCTQCEIEARDAEIERLTARVHDLENELAAGVHTCSPTCRKTPACATRADLREENERLRARGDAVQARLDALMLEFCPDEMTEEQIETWARHQRPATGSE